MLHFALIPDESLHTILPFIMLLNPKSDETTMLARLEEMRTQAYVCVGAYDGDRLIGVSGLWIMTKFYVGKHIEPDNVIIHPDYRGQGIGEQMLAWIFEYGRSQGCIASELNCYVANKKGVRFWIKQGYDIIGYHFQRSL